MAAEALPESCPRESFLWVWPATAAYLGSSLDLAPHSTSVHCLVVGVDAPVRVFIDGEAGVTARSVLIPPRVVHRVEVHPNARILFCYADLNRARVDQLISRLQRRVGSLGVDFDDEAALIRACEVAPEGSSIRQLVLGNALPVTAPHITRTLERLRADPATAMTATEMARLEGLSRAYFLRLFGAETGTSFRRYRLWTRMLHTARAVAAGSDLTRASLDAGFATPSHFSDSFLRMFGLTATALAASGAQLIVSDELGSGGIPGTPELTVAPRS